MLHWLRNITRTVRSYFIADRVESAGDALVIEVTPLQETISGIQPPSSTDNLSALEIAKSFCALVLSKENLPRITGASILTALGTGLNFLSPYLLGEAIQALNNKEEETVNIAGVEVSRATILIGLFIAAHSMSKLVTNQRDQMMVPVTSNNTRKLIIRGTDHLLKKSLDCHVNKTFNDHFYLLQKCFAVSSVSTPLLTQILPTIAEISIASTLLTSRYGIGMGAGIVGLLATYSVYGAATAKSIVETREEMLKVGNETYEALSTTIMQYKPMYDFGKYEHAMKEIDKIVSKMATVEVRAFNKPLHLSQGYIGLSHLHMLATLLYVGAGVRSGKYSTQEFMVLAGYLGSLASLLPGFGQAVSQLFASYPDLKYVFGELSKPDEVIDLHEDTPLMLRGAPTIKFDNVSFTYPTKPNEGAKPPLFHNLSFTISPGQTVALVSESGAGKTTLFNLLYGYYKPSSGRILINGQDISLVSLKSLQKQIALFGQSANLFKGSIRDNICYGAEDPTLVTDDEIWAQARAANLYEFLQEFPDKLNTDVGENGKALSGGQQQKVSILRALFKKGAIRLLDEITAPFDSQSATQVLQSMHATNAGVTSLMITHKLTEAQSVDKIIVLATGSVVAEGTHTELLASCPLYQKLWKAYSTQLASSSTGTMMSVLSRIPNASGSLLAAQDDASVVSREQDLQPTVIIEDEEDRLILSSGASGAMRRH